MGNVNLIKLLFGKCMQGLGKLIAADAVNSGLEKLGSLLTLSLKGIGLLQLRKPGVAIYTGPSDRAIEKDSRAHPSFN